MRCSASHSATGSPCLAVCRAVLQLKGLLKQMLTGDYRDHIDPRDKRPPPPPPSDEALLETSRLMEEAMAECTAAAKTDAVRAFAKQFGSESEHQFRADEVALRSKRQAVTAPTLFLIVRVGAQVDRLVEQLMNTGFDDARTRRLLDGMEFESKEVETANTSLNTHTHLAQHIYTHICKHTHTFDLRFDRIGQRVFRKLTAQIMARSRRPQRTRC